MKVYGKGSEDSLLIQENRSQCCHGLLRFPHPRKGLHTQMSKCNVDNSELSNDALLHTEPEHNPLAGVDSLPQQGPSPSRDHSVPGKWSVAFS